MSGSGGFFYDDCRSGDRLAREYTLYLGAALPTVTLDGTRFTYRWEAVNAGMILNSFLLTSTWELTFKMKYNIALFRQLRIYPSMRSVTDRYEFDISFGDQIYWSMNGLFGGWSPAPAPVQNTWWYVKIRNDGAKTLFKFWIEGAAEPNWQNNTSSPSGGIRLRYPRPMSGRIGFSALCSTAGEYIEIADIRITPIRKVGGP